MEAPDTKGLGWLILAIAIFCAVAGWGLIELARNLLSHIRWVQ